MINMYRVQALGNNDFFVESVRTFVLLFLLVLHAIFCLDGLEILAVEHLLLVQDAHLSLDALLAMQLQVNQTTLLLQDDVAQVLVDELLLELSLRLEEDLLLQFEALKGYVKQLLVGRTKLTFTFMAFSSCFPTPVGTSSYVRRRLATGSALRRDGVAKVFDARLTVLLEELGLRLGGFGLSRQTEKFGSSTFISSSSETERASEASVGAVAVCVSCVSNRICVDVSIAGTSEADVPKRAGLLTAEKTCMSGRNAFSGRIVTVKARFSLTSKHALIYRFLCRFP